MIVSVKFAASWGKSDTRKKRFYAATYAASDIVPILRVDGTDPWLLCINYSCFEHSRHINFSSYAVQCLKHGCCLVLFNAGWIVVLLILARKKLFEGVRLAKDGQLCHNVEINQRL
ncbi:MAG: hypothetical protein IGNPGNKH_00185 [Sodalis sp. Ffu]|nr:MAG: hypothetical protein IGNPGNKH_00185 [Sodalis sp. Ffu]